MAGMGRAQKEEDKKRAVKVKPYWRPLSHHPADGM